MDPANVIRVDCHVSKWGFVDKIDFVSANDAVATTTMTDISLNQSEDYVIKSVDLVPGERITGVRALNKEVEFVSEAGNCVDANTSGALSPYKVTKVSASGIVECSTKCADDADCKAFYMDQYT